MSVLNLIGRKKELFVEDIQENLISMKEEVKNSKILVIGGAGTIGQAVSKGLFKLNPGLLHVVDISENNMVELVRELRSSIGYIKGEFEVFAIDCGNKDFKAFFNKHGPYDYIFNLSALKHVRSEKDEFTLMRMVEVNILNTLLTIELAKDTGCKKYFCVSTDKAANPANMMGASKRIMEMFLMKDSKDINISMARFANVAFSDGSLLHGFNQRFQKRQPIAAPSDIRRYFITPKESGELCLMSSFFGANRDIFFPKLSKELDLITFSDIAESYIKDLGFEPYLCKSEDEARKKSSELISQKKWPCFFFKSDTTGEKSYEEFFTDNEIIDMNRFSNIGVIKSDTKYHEKDLSIFIDSINRYRNDGIWTKSDILDLFFMLLPEFAKTYKSTGKYLQGRM